MIPPPLTTLAAPAPARRAVWLAVWLAVLGLAAPRLAQGQTNYTPYYFTTLAGTSVDADGDGWADGGWADATGSAARFNLPAGVTVDRTGNVFVAEQENVTLRRVTPAGEVTTLAGRPWNRGSLDGPGSTAQFRWPSGVAVDGTGNVYVADSANGTLRQVTPAGEVATLAGKAGLSGSTDALGDGARFNWPSGVAVDHAGNVYVADQENSTIRKVTPTGEVSTLAGKAGFQGSAEGRGDEASFNWPASVAVDRDGNVYVADTGNSTIRKVTPAGEVSTLAGLARHYGHADARGSEARFAVPSGVAVDAMGNVFVADSGSSTIRLVTPAGDVSTLAGDVQNPGSADGSGSSARFNAPLGIAVDAAGNVFVADTDNHTIRIGRPCAFSLSLTGATFAAAGGLGSVTVSNPCGGAWTVTNNGAGWITFVSGSTGESTPAAVQFRVAAHASRKARSATLTIAGQPLLVTQGPRRSQGDLDFNGDGRADITVYDPEPGDWYVRFSGGGTRGSRWGGGTMAPVRGDFDGDGKSDPAAYYAEAGDWFLNLSAGGMRTVRWGFRSAVPMPGDFDGDGKTDCAVCDTNAGDWYLPFSGGGSTAIHWGWKGAVPLTGDFDGDGKNDLVAYDATLGDWYVRYAKGTSTKFNWGGGDMQPFVGDFDGDGKSDAAVYYAAAATWYLRFSQGGSTAISWGGGAMLPVLGDYDGDGKTDLAAYDAAGGTWYLRFATGAMTSVRWGWTGATAP